jgi:hypothetical protein
LSSCDPAKNNLISEASYDCIVRRCLRQIIPADVKLRKLPDQEILRKIQAEGRNKIAGLTIFAMGVGVGFVLP